MRVNTCRLLSLLLGAALSTTTAIGAARAADPAAPRASTPAERQARGEAAARAFMMGRYDEALATYTDLYIQSDGRPEYLRNIGRCQQKLKQYAQAIDSFKEYLRRAKRLGADERKEVQGFISEMEAAQASGSGNGATAAAPTRAAPPAATTTPPAPAPAPIAPAPAPAPAPSGAPAPAAPYAPRPPTSYSPASTPSYPPAPAPSYAPGPAPSYAPAPAPTYAPAPSYGPAPPSYYGARPQTTPSGTNLGMSGSSGGPPAAINSSAGSTPPDLITRSPGPEPAAKSSPLKAIGIVSVVAAGAAAIGGTVMLVRAKSIYDQAMKDNCPTRGTSFCDPKADSVSTANTVSKIFFVGAGVLGVAGVAMIVVAPAPAPDSRVSLAVSVSGRF
ncbi:MAG TPA: tetratricopeptide repeat protein [Polyangia bacterium]|nr:tetratricopeptide repeat protein [Polyangia bacterium]